MMCIVAVLQKHYRHLEALALEHENVEEALDLTLPDLDMISRRAGALLDQFTAMVYPEGYDPEKPTAKRKVGAGTSGLHEEIYLLRELNSKYTVLMLSSGYLE